MKGICCDALEFVRELARASSGQFLGSAADLSRFDHPHAWLDSVPAADDAGWLRLLRVCAAEDHGQHARRWMARRRWVGAVITLAGEAKASFWGLGRQTQAKWQRRHRIRLMRNKSGSTCSRFSFSDQPPPSRVGASYMTPLRIIVANSTINLRM